MKPELRQGSPSPNTNTNSNLRTRLSRTLGSRALTLGASGSDGGMSVLTQGFENHHPHHLQEPNNANWGFKLKWFKIPSQETLSFLEEANPKTSPKSCTSENKVTKEKTTKEMSMEASIRSNQLQNQTQKDSRY